MCLLQKINNQIALEYLKASADFGYSKALKKANLLELKFAGAARKKCEELGLPYKTVQKSITRHYATYTSNWVSDEGAKSNGKKRE